MCLRDRISTDPPRAPWKVCSVCWLYGVITPDDGDALDVMLADVPRWPGRVLEQVLRDEFGVVIGVDSVGKHRRANHGRPDVPA